MAEDDDIIMIMGDDDETASRRRRYTAEDDLLPSPSPSPLSHESGGPPRKRIRYTCGDTAATTTAADGAADATDNVDACAVSASSSSSDEDDDESNSDSNDEDDGTTLPPQLSENNNDDGDCDSDFVKERRVRFAPGSGNDNSTAAVVTLIGPDAKHPRPSKDDGCWWTRTDRCSFLEDNRLSLDEFHEEHDDQVRHFHRVQARCLDLDDDWSDRSSCSRGTTTSKSSVEDEAACLPALILPASVRGLESGFQRLRDDDDDDDDDDDSEDDDVYDAVSRLQRRRNVLSRSPSLSRLNSSQRRKHHAKLILELQEEILLEHEDDDDCYFGVRNHQHCHDDDDDHDDDESYRSSSTTTVIKRDLSVALRQQSEKSSRGHRLLARLLAKGDEIQAKGGRPAGAMASRAVPPPSSPHHYHSHHLLGGSIRPKQQQLFRSRCTIMPHY